jgi:hypothetical protein
MAKWIAALFSLIALSSFAQTRFDGTWRMRMDTLQFSGTPEEYLITHDIYHCLSCEPKIDVKADGVDHKVIGHEAYYDTIAIRVLDSQALDFTFKRNGRLVAASKETVAADGKTMIEEFRNTPGTDPVKRKSKVHSRRRWPLWLARTLRPVADDNDQKRHRSRKAYDVSFDPEWIENH